MNSLFALALVGMAVAGISASAAEERRKRQEMFEKFAASVGGTVLVDATWARPFPVVGLVHRGLHARVEQTSTGGKHPVHHVEITLEIEAANPGGLRMEIYPQSLFSSLGKLFGMQDIEIGEPRFDANFVLKSNRPDELHQILDARARSLVDDLWRVHGSSDFLIHLDRRLLRMKKRQMARNAGDLELLYRNGSAFFDSVLRVLDPARLRRSYRDEVRSPVGAGNDAGGIRFLDAPGEDPGVRFVEPGIQIVVPGRDREEGIRFLAPAQKVEPRSQRRRPKAVAVRPDPPPLPLAPCQVCGEDIHAEPADRDKEGVRCAWCRVPHHRACWDLNARCVAAGCGSIRTLRM